jgi:integrase
MAIVEKLDQAFVDSQLICPPGKKRIELVDPLRTGLYIEVRATSQGQGTFYLRYKDKSGKTCHQKVARTTEITLAAARSQVKTIKAGIVATGADPRGEKRAEKAVPTLGALWEMYEEYAKPRLRSAKKLESLWRLHLKERYAHVQISELRRHELLAYHVSLVDKNFKNLSEAQADHVIKLVRAMLNWAVEAQVIQVNPIAKVKLFNPDNKIGHFLTPEELKRLMAVLQTDKNRTVALLVTFQLATSARLNESLSATFGDINVERRTWHIPVAASKTRRSRIVPLNDLALDVIAELRHDQLKNGKLHNHLFVSPKTGEKLSYVHKVWDRLRKQANLPKLRLHDARHTGASLILASGAGGMEVVQRVLGHSTYAVTASTYAHVSQQRLIDAVQASSTALKTAMREAASESVSEDDNSFPEIDFDAIEHHIA